MGKQEKTRKIKCAVAVAGVPDEDGNIVDEETLKKMAEENNNLVFKNGTLYVILEIKEWEK